MAPEAGEAEQDDENEEDKNRAVETDRHPVKQNGEEEGSEEEEEEEEPRLKYASLTTHLKPVYRNDDATSAFLVAGDKMVGCRALLLEHMILD